MSSSHTTTNPEAAAYYVRPGPAVDGTRWVLRRLPSIPSTSNVDPPTCYAYPGVKPTFDGRRPSHTCYLKACPSFPFTIGHNTYIRQGIPVYLDPYGPRRFEFASNGVTYAHEETPPSPDPYWLRGTEGSVSSESETLTARSDSTRAVPMCRSGSRETQATSVGEIESVVAAAALTAAFHAHAPHDNFVWAQYNPVVGGVAWGGHTVTGMTSNYRPVTPEAFDADDFDADEAVAHVQAADERRMHGASAADEAGFRTGYEYLVIRSINTTEQGLAYSTSLVPGSPVESWSDRF